MNHHISNIHINNILNNLIFQEYSNALNFVRLFLQIEPGNQQVQSLETIIKKRMEKGIYFEI